MLGACVESVVYRSCGRILQAIDCLCTEIDMRCFEIEIEATGRWRRIGLIAWEGGCQMYTEYNLHLSVNEDFF